MGLVKMMIRKAREERETFKAKAGSRLNSNWPRTLPSISSQQLQPTHRIVKANATPLSLLQRPAHTPLPLVHFRKIYTSRPTLFTANPLM